jgi:hypothetical protein
VLPIAVVVLLMRTRWFKRRKRVIWAGEKLVWWRDTMDRLPPPFGDLPRGPRDRRR